MRKKQYLVAIGMIFLFVGLMGVVLGFLSVDIIRNIIANMAQFYHTDSVHTHTDMSMSISLSYVFVAVGIGLIAFGIIRTRKR